MCWLSPIISFSMYENEIAAWAVCSPGSSVLVSLAVFFRGRAAWNQDLLSGKSLDLFF